MCGIYGGFWQRATDVSSECLKETQKLLHHRGPDDNGAICYPLSKGAIVLGHTRLSIIDLSPAGHQPMVDAGNRFSIVFNGEIYNYRELRKELREIGHEFHGDSDTEVLLHCWAEWGEQSLPRLVGMFAFTVFDHRTEKQTLVRDAFGIKPLFFMSTKDRLVFASSIEAIKQLQNGQLSFNAQRAFDYLVYKVQDTGVNTFAHGVNHIPPAHLLHYEPHKNESLEVQRWWNPSIQQDNSLSYSDAAEKLRSLFLESIKLHLRSDVALGVALSGGLDSSAIACCMRHLQPDMEIHTFSFIAKNSPFSEEPWIDLVNQQIQGIPHQVVVNEGDLLNDIDHLIQVQGEPFCTTSIYAQYRVFKAASEAGIKVVLEGQGGDELLAGYDGYQGQRMRSLFEQGQWQEMRRFSNNWSQWPGRKHLSPWRAFIGQMLPNSLFRLAQPFVGIKALPEWIDRNQLSKLSIATHGMRQARSTHARGRRVIETLRDAIGDGGLPSLLRYGDRNAMAFSIENRVPFLTVPLAEFLFSLPENYLIDVQGATKSVFRAAMRGIVPDKILDRRDKIGFETPMGEWVGQLVQQIADELHTENGATLWDKNILQDHLSKTNQNISTFTSQDWRLVNFILWKKALIDSRSHATFR
jgi:asparagine synthase (glutamine-hydrolysing)